MESSYFINCPHCGIDIEILKNEINCTIFRCGKYKLNGQQINPHLPKEECDRLKQNDLIWGCGKPFKFDGAILNICGYI